MSEVRTVSLTHEQWEYVRTKGLSLSRLLRIIIKKRMEGEEDVEYYKTRCEILSLKHQEAINFIEKEGLSDVFFQRVEAKRTNRGTKSKSVRAETKD